MSDLSEALRVINSKKGKENIKKYPSFMINRILSYHLDCIEIVNKINGMKIPDEWKFEYLFYSIPKKYRYKQYQKLSSEEIDDILLVMEYYQLSFNKARKMNITKRLINKIRKEMDTGGI